MRHLLKAAIVSLTIGYATPSSAGCGLEVTFDNTFDTPITVLEVESKTPPGGYATVHDSPFTVAAGETVTKAIETKMGCKLPHVFRVKYKKGEDEHYKTKGPVVTAVDKKINIKFD